MFAGLSCCLGSLQGTLWILLLTKVDLWEWCCTSRGFSLSSTRFSTFFCPRWSPGGTCTEFAERCKGRRSFLCCETWRITEWFVKPCLYLVVSGLCQPLQVQGCASSRVVRSCWINHHGRSLLEMNKKSQHPQTRFVSFGIWPKC